MVVERGLREAVGGEEAPVVVEDEAHAEPEARETPATGLALGLVQERARDAAPAMVWMHGEPADVKSALLLVPEHGAHDDAVVVDDGATTVCEMLADAGGCLLQGARWRIGAARLGRKGETDQGSDRRGIRCASRPVGPGRRHTTPRSIRRPA